MKTNEVQELLEGMLTDEQTAEVLHRLSVSPEKLSAFREHMALRGAFDQDARAGALKDEEGDTVWAAVLGTTGAVVGTGLGASGWLAKAGAFLLTGLAGIGIGIGFDKAFWSDDSAAAATPTVAENVISRESLQQNSTPPTVRVDTVVQRIVEPEIVYRDRIRYVDRPASAANPSREDVSIAVDDNERVDDRLGIGYLALQSLKGMSANRESMPASSNGVASANSDGTTTPAIAPTGLSMAAASTVVDDRRSPKADPRHDDPNRHLATNSADARSDTDTDPEVPDDEEAASRYSLMKDGFELGYNERLGRVNPAPTVSDRSEPSFGGRSLDLNLRFLEGKFGLGARLIHGSFAEVKLEEETWSGLSLADTILVPSLEPATEFSLEVFADWRIPIASERFAVGLEGSFGLSSARLTATGDLSAMYLITPNIGAQIGVGYGGYRYTTQQQREQALDRFYNSGVTSDFNDSYSGTLLEGRYGLFYKF